MNYLAADLVTTLEYWHMEGLVRIARMGHQHPPVSQRALRNMAELNHILAQRVRD